MQEVDRNVQEGPLSCSVMIQADGDDVVCILFFVGGVLPNYLYETVAASVDSIMV